MNKYTPVFIIVVVFFGHSLGLEYNKRQYNQNTDFLIHEAGGHPAPKRDFIAPQPTNGNNQSPNTATKKPDFPPLGPPPSQQNNLKPQSPQPTRATQSSGKRDYVNPNYPPLNPPTNTQQPARSTQPTVRPPSSTLPSQQSTSNNNRRDYVNPNFPPLNTNSQQGAGKVKDLVNFYDGKKQPANVPQGVPSYSSILQKPNGQPQGAAVTIPTQKPMSFSSIVSGQNRPSTTITTRKPTNAGAFSTPMNPAHTGNKATTRPTVLPSSIVNNNRNQGGSGNSASNTELQTLSEELLKKDINNAARYTTINYQGKLAFNSNEDKAPLPLLTVSPEAWNIPTIQKFIPLLDNYERDTLVNEHVTPQERIEENDFMDAIMSTSVIRHLMNFLKEKGYVTPDPRQQRDFLKQMWFSLYSRGKGKLGSSGFEHSFVSELKNGQILGLHNWIYFAREEQANRVNYLGYTKHEELGDKGSAVKFSFTYQGVQKPVTTIIVGASPELEIALYTLCFVTREDDDCKLKLSGKELNILTHKFRYRSKNYIGSAYAQI